MRRRSTHNVAAEIVIAKITALMRNCIIVWCAATCAYARNSTHKMSYARNSTHKMSYARNSTHKMLYARNSTHKMSTAGKSLTASIETNVINFFL